MVGRGHAWHKGWAATAIAAVAVAMACCSPALGAVPRWSVVAHRGIQELMGSGDGSPVAWNPHTGLWGGRTPPHWWQSAQALMTLVSYADATHDRGPAIQRILVRTYELNRTAELGNFTNGYRDDTGWWGLAWEGASQYELYQRHDRRDAALFLRTAEIDASHIAGLPRGCGGIRWNTNYPPDTTTNAEFVDLAARLARYLQAPGTFHDPAKARRWRTGALADLAWLEHSGLINLMQGVARRRLGTSCQPQGGALTVTMGETADALVQVGQLTRNRLYYVRAAAFLRSATDPGSPMMGSGVFQEPCEALAPSCATERSRLDETSRKGIFMLAVADWDHATRGREFIPFVDTQAAAIVHHDILGAGVGSPGCETPHRCQFGFSWDGGVPWMLITPGTQISALDALIATIR
jgi:hypothetical protein